MDFGAQILVCRKKEKTGKVILDTEGGGAQKLCFARRDADFFFMLIIPLFFLVASVLEKKSQKFALFFGVGGGEEEREREQREKEQEGTLKEKLEQKKKIRKATHTRRPFVCLV